MVGKRDRTIIPGAKRPEKVRENARLRAATVPRGLGRAETGAIDPRKRPRAEMSTIIMDQHPAIATNQVAVTWRSERHSLAAVTRLN
jgi:hypothetical protein